MQWQGDRAVTLGVLPGSRTGRRVMACPEVTPLVIHKNDSSLGIPPTQTVAVNS